MRIDGLGAPFGLGPIQAGQESRKHQPDHGQQRPNDQRPPGQPAGPRAAEPAPDAPSQPREQRPFDNLGVEKHPLTSLSTAAALIRQQILGSLPRPVGRTAAERTVRPTQPDSESPHVA